MRKWSEKLAAWLLLMGLVAIALGLFFAFTSRPHLQGSPGGDMFFLLGTILFIGALSGSIQEMRMAGRIIWKLVCGK
jgi:NhaP-type Na+/H+ or K+/H+ antiporter